MRRPRLWVVAIVVGVVVVTGVVALVGRDDDEDQTVPAGAWADTVCGSVAVWHGQIESIVGAIRDPRAVGSRGAEEAQPATPQGQRTFIHDGLEQAIQATATVVTAIDNAGVPDSENGEESARAISGWADATRNDLQVAQDSLDDAADTPADAVAQLADAARAITEAVTGGVKAIADVGRTDPELATALRGSSTCQQLREETTS